MIKWSGNNVTAFQVKGPESRRTEAKGKREMFYVKCIFIKDFYGLPILDREYGDIWFVKYTIDVKYL